MLSRMLVPAASWGGGRRGGAAWAPVIGSLCPGKWLDSEGWLFRHSGMEVLRTHLASVFKTAFPSPYSWAGGKEEE